jgi:hypothetical protein
MKELTKVQNEKIYNETIIKIRFPDLICVQGYFHPRHTIIDVYDWIFSLFSSNFLQQLQQQQQQQQQSFYNKHKKGSSDEKLWKRVFELFQSPPKRVFETEIKKKSNFQEEKLPSLYDLNLVPAAVINLSWNASINPLIHNVPLGYYLSEQYLQRSDEKYAHGNPNLNSGMYPVGQRLTVDSESDTKVNEKLNSLPKIVAPSEEKISKGKPKWLKI